MPLLPPPLNPPTTLPHSPPSDRRSGQGLNGCTGPSKDPRMAHCPGARGLEGTQGERGDAGWGSEGEWSPPQTPPPRATGVPAVTRAGSGGHVSSLVQRNLDGVTKISRELTGAPSAGGPASAAASECRRRRRPPTSKDL